VITQRLIPGSSVGLCRKLNNEQVHHGAPYIYSNTNNYRVRTTSGREVIFYFFCQFSPNFDIYLRKEDAYIFIFAHHLLMKIMILMARSALDLAHSCDAKSAASILFIVLVKLAWSHGICHFNI